jgi:hypothetical protein
LRAQNDEGGGKAGHKPALGFDRAKEAERRFLIYRKYFWTF